jgi:hypothetical protein
LVSLTSYAAIPSPSAVDSSTGFFTIIVPDNQQVSERHIKKQFPAAVTFGRHNSFRHHLKNTAMKKVILAIVIITGLATCKPTTEITGSWKNANVNAGTTKINRILVTALTARTNARQTVENDVAAALEKKGYETVKSIEVLPPTFTDGEKPDKNELYSKINETGADAILTVALLNKETENRYVPGNYNYAPIPRFGYYGTFWGYYNTRYPTLYSDGYYEEDEVYFIETNLYDAKTEELLWSAQSETYNAGSLASFAEDFAEVVVTEMEEEGLLERGNANELAKERPR